jgi:hypothetical protein
VIWPDIMGQICSFSYWFVCSELQFGSCNFKVRWLVKSSQHGPPNSQAKLQPVRRAEGAKPAIDLLYKAVHASRMQSDVLGVCVTISSAPHFVQSLNAGERNIRPFVQRGFVGGFLGWAGMAHGAIFFPLALFDQTPSGDPSMCCERRQQKVNL